MATAFVDIQVCADSDKCQKCLAWGRTYHGGGAVRCPTCNRPTFPNEGVNKHPGTAWAHSGVSAMDSIQARGSGLMLLGAPVEEVLAYRDARQRRRREYGTWAHR